MECCARGGRDCPVERVDRDDVVGLPSVSVCVPESCAGDAKKAAERRLEKEASDTASGSH